MEFVALSNVLPVLGSDPGLYRVLAHNSWGVGELLPSRAWQIWRTNETACVFMESMHFHDEERRPIASAVDEPWRTVAAVLFFCKFAPAMAANLLLCSHDEVGKQRKGATSTKTCRLSGSL